MLFSSMVLFMSFVSEALTDSNSISTMLGKGANCALLDAVDLAESLRRPEMLNPTKRRTELRKRAEENVKRRMKERQRAALIQNLVYFGDNKLKEFCRDQGLKMAFDVSANPRTFSLLIAMGDLILGSGLMIRARLFRMRNDAWNSNSILHIPHDESGVETMTSIPIR